MPLALWYTAPGTAELRPAAAPEPGPGEVRVRALWSGLSRGTERLVLAGAVPASEHQRMRAPMQEGEFPFPVKYGYALVGRVEAGEAALVGREVFLLHPHQALCTVAAAAVHPLPPELPARRAPLAANMETALNVLWDARVAPCDSVLVVGGGVLGLLVAGVAARIPGTRVTVVDTDPSRAALAQALGARFAPPDAAPADQDVVIHTSASEAGLRLALACAGVEARVAEASWYGDRPVSLPLGEAFHSRRLTLLSTQVGGVPADRRARWTYARRLRAALDLLQDEAFDALITGEVAFAEAPAALPAILAPGSPGLMTVLRYT